MSKCVVIFIFAAFAVLASTDALEIRKSSIRLNLLKAFQCRFSIKLVPAFLKNSILQTIFFAGKLNRARIEINDDADMPVVQFTQSAYAVPESNKLLRVAMKRTGTQQQNRKPPNRPLIRK